MADKYLDHGLYTSLGATPTWGAAQDGDGMAIGAATPATVSIDLTSAVFAAGTSFVSIMGCTAIPVTASANSATNIQYSATLTTLIDNIVTVINALLAATTYVDVNRPSNFRAQNIRDVVYARRNGNALELMTRAGSASWNGLVAVAFSGVTNASSGSWSGGASGAWGWALNIANAFGTALAVGTYGAWCQNGVLAGSFDGGDVVYVRANKTVTLTTTNYSCIFSTGMGSEFNPVRFRIDRSEKWSDGTDPVFTIQQAFDTNGYNLTFGAIYSTSYVVIEGKRISEGVYNFNLTGRSNYQTLNGGAKLFVNGPMTISGCKIENTAGSTTGFQTTGSATDNNSQTTLNDCYFRWNNSSPLISSGNGKQSRVLMNACTFDNSGNSVAHPYLFYCEQYVETVYTFNGCRFVNFVAGSKMISQPTQAFGYRSKIIFSDCDFGNVTDRGPLFALQTTSYFSPPDKYIAVDDRLGKNEFALDTCDGFVEWNASRSQPVLNALLQDGTGWSIRVVPSTNASRAGVARPIVLPDLAKRNTLGNNKLRLKLELLAEKSLTLTPATVSITAYYKTAAGSREAVDSLVQQIAPATSTATWSQMLADPADSVSRPTFVQGGTIYFNRYSLTLDTLSAVADATDVTLVVSIRALAADITKMIFIDPEITMVTI